MHKLLAARHYLLERLNIGADQLLTFAQEGTVISHRAAAAPRQDAGHRNGDFALRYTAHFIATDYAGAPADLFWTMLNWLHADNPSVKPDALAFHVDILDQRRADVSLRVDLSETIHVETSASGTLLRPSRDADALAFGVYDGVSGPQTTAS